MEKISLTIAWKTDGSVEILAQGGPEECLEVYHANVHNDKYSFVGMLRKPRWHKRIQPVISKERHEKRLERNRKIEEETARSRADHLERIAETAAKAAEDATEEAKLLRAKEAELAKGAVKPTPKKKAPSKKKAPAKSED